MPGISSLIVSKNLLNPPIKPFITSSIVPKIPLKTALITLPTTLLKVRNAFIAPSTKLSMPIFILSINGKIKLIDLSIVVTTVVKIFAAFSRKLLNNSITIIIIPTNPARERALFKSFPVDTAALPTNCKPFTTCTRSCAPVFFI